MPSGDADGMAGGIVMLVLPSNLKRQFEIDWTIGSGSPQQDGSDE